MTFMIFTNSSTSQPCIAKSLGQATIIFGLNYHKNLQSDLPAFTLAALYTILYAAARVSIFI